MFTLLIVIIAIALIFDLVNGFHDAANSIATVVSTKVLTPLQAVIWAAVFNVAAFWVFDMSVGNTVAKTVDNGAIDLWVILAGLLAATTWNLVTWWFGIPSSSSHTLIGGFAGAAVAHAGLDVINSAEILKVILFIFLAPIIGGLIAFLIALITISRNIGYKFLSFIGLTVGVIFLMNYMVEYMDVKPVMMWITIVIMGAMTLTYFWYFVLRKKRQTALRESNMYKKLQLLSSAAFSLGHGGADSQKVMGIICAACMVYANFERENGNIESIPKDLQVTEVLEIEYHDEDGKKVKYKPQVGEYNGILLMKSGDNIVDMESGEVVFEDKKLNPAYAAKSKLASFKKVEKEVGKLKIYSRGDTLYDGANNQAVFLDKKLNPNYAFAGAFNDFVLDGELKSDHKIKTKVHSESMPLWIAMSCYLAIGLGTLLGGWKIVKTMGTKITKVTPLEGVCAETAGALTLFTVSNMGIPVSTTHTITGSIIGVGATKRLSAVRWGVTINLLWAWILTIPVTGGMAALFYYGIKLLN